MKTERIREFSLNRFEKASVNIVLLVLLCLIVVISGIVIVGAYYSYKVHTKKIEDTVGRIARDVNATEGPSDIQKQNRCFVEYLKEVSKGAAQPGNITFLFTVFSVALVSGCVYLLEHSRRNVERSNESARIANETAKSAQDMVDKLKAKAEEAEKTADSSKEKAKAAEDSLEKRETLRKISVLLSRGEDISQQLQQSKERERFNTVVGLRDSVRSAYSDLEYLVRRRDKLSIRQCHRFREHVVAIQANLEALSDEFQEQVRDIIEQCDKIIVLFRELC